MGCMTWHGNGLHSLGFGVYACAVHSWNGSNNIEYLKAYFEGEEIFKSD